jgi:hypothetical protein
MKRCCQQTLSKLKVEALGLRLNINKCKFISDNATPSIYIFQDFVKLDPGNSMLLGAPLRTGRAMDAALTKRCDELALTISRQKTLPSHDALMLLKASFSFPKLLHILRSSRCVGHSGLQNFDSLQRFGLSLMKIQTFQTLNGCRLVSRLRTAAWGCVG